MSGAGAVRVSAGSSVTSPELSPEDLPRVIASHNGESGAGVNLGAVPGAQIQR